jgi:hypothetical protein
VFQIPLNTSTSIFPSHQELSMPMIMLLYSRYYAIKKLHVSPADQGHAGVDRDRIYLVLALKGKVEELHDVQDTYSKVSQFIKRRVQTRPCDYLVASWDELQREAQAVAMTRKKKFSMNKVPLLDLTKGFVCNFPQCVTVISQKRL